MNQNNLRASISVANIEPLKDHFFTNGTIVTAFSDSDNFTIHITPQHAKALIEWAESIYDTFIRNGFCKDTDMNTYGMFSSGGDNLVRLAISSILNSDVENWTVDNVIENVISMGNVCNISVGEVNDTAVREYIMEALENARISND